MPGLSDDVSSYLKRRARWSPLEIAFWVFAFASIWLFPSKHLILTETAILGLFALSLDLILGYAGILSLGQAAFFGLAGLGGALGAEILGLDPTFPLKYMIYFLIVVTVGGTTSITGPFLASILLGIADVAGKYYVPKLGAFVIYTIMIIVLIWRPQGLFARSVAR